MFVPRARANRVLLAVALLFSVATLTGCVAASGSLDHPPTFDPATVPKGDDLRSRLDEELQWEYDHRELNTTDHAAWQAIHGILAYGDEFDLVHEGRRVPAGRYLIDGGKLKGWRLEPAAKGVRVVLEAGSGTGQGHPDQWLSKLARCGFAVDDKVVVGGQDYTIGDLVEQAKWELYEGKEASWTIIALSYYLKPDETWTAADGTQWSLARVMNMEADNALGEGACGGTHRLYGLAVGLDFYRRHHPDAELTGAWKKARDLLDEAARTARAYQQPDGSFSTSYFERPGSIPDFKERIATTGHTLEALTMAATPEQLREPWMEASVDYLCRLLKQLRGMDLECGSLYHAIHGLVLYREKRFGPRTYRVVVSGE